LKVLLASFVSSKLLVIRLDLLLAKGLKKTSDAREGGMKRCDQCNGRFGLVRYRLAQNQFCSERCLRKYKTANEGRISRLKGWVDFLARKS
jgi:hypothetical protein